MYWRSDENDCATGSYLLVNRTYYKQPNGTLPWDWTVEVIFHAKGGNGINNPVFIDNHLADYKSGGSPEWFHDYQPDFVGAYNNEYPFHLTALDSQWSYGPEEDGYMGDMPDAFYGDWYRVDGEDGNTWYYCDPHSQFPRDWAVPEGQTEAYYSGKAYLKEVRDPIGNRIKLSYIHHTATDEYYVSSLKEYPPDSNVAIREIGFTYTQYSDGYLRLTVMTLFPGTSNEKAIHYNYMHDSGEKNLGKWIMALAEYPDGTWGVYDTGINENEKPYFEFMDSHLAKDKKARYFMGKILDGNYSSKGGIYEGQEVFVNGAWVEKEIREHVVTDDHIRVTHCDGFQENWTYDPGTGIQSGYTNNHGTTGAFTVPGPQITDAAYGDGRTRHFHYDSLDREDGLHIVRTDYEDGSSDYETFFKWVKINYGDAYKRPGGMPYQYHTYHVDNNCTAYHLCQDPYHWEQRILTRSKTDREGATTRTWYNFRFPDPCGVD